MVLKVFCRLFDGFEGFLQVLKVFCRLFDGFEGFLQVV